MPSAPRLWLCLASLALAACSGKSASPPAQPAAAGSGTAALAAGSGTAGSAAGSGAAAAGRVASAGTGGSPVAGTPASTAGASAVGGAPASSPDAGTASDAGTPTDAATSMPAVTECMGKALPPRAIAGMRPFPVGPESAGLPAYWPTMGWKSETPEKLGFDATKLMAAADFKTQHSTTQAVFVVRHGYLALEKYSSGFSANSQHESYSMAKSFTSGLMGIAIGEGKIPGGLDAKLCEYYPMQWNCSDMSDPRSRITIDHAMNLTTGLMWTEDWRSTATGFNDGLTTSLDGVLMRKSVEEPGKTKRYSTGDPALLSGVLQKVTGMSALAYAKQKVFDVIGTPDIKWNADNSGRTTTFAGLQATARDYAKYGYLYLNRGKWDGKQVIPEDWVDFTTNAKHPCEDWNQYLWHINPPVRLGKQPASCDSLFCQPTDFANLPPDAFFAEGVSGQFVFVIPSRDLVIVRLANDPLGSDYWDEFAEGFLGAMLDAMK